MKMHALFSVFRRLLWIICALMIFSLFLQYKFAIDGAVLLVVDSLIFFFLFFCFTFSSRYS